MRTIKPPKAAGLYHPEHEHDACGVAFVAKITGEADHGVVGRALYALENLEHRGAAGADPTTGDGAGILLQLPDEFFRAVVPFPLPERGRFAVGVLFLPQEQEEHDRIVALVDRTVADEGQKVLGWRDVPVDEAFVGVTAGAAAPRIRQVFVGAADELPDQLAFERKLYVIRRLIEKGAGPELAIPSFSSRTVVYKGMLTAPQMSGYYPDLKDERMVTRLALVHSRFSTNTFPSWELAHPYRMLAHNGEINTLRGNINWMRARESQLLSEHFGDDLDKIMPVVREGGSDSATFDNVLELLVLDGRPITHAVMMMVPEAYRDNAELPPAVRGFYDYHSCVMEPWDGPAAICFTDGTQVGATLDRNGLRPGRWVQTVDGYVVLASETGVIKAKPNEIVRKGRLQPGKIFLVDLEQGRIVEDEEVKARIAGQRPYGEWYAERVVHLEDLPERAPRAPRVEPLRSKQLAFGYSQEDLRITIAPMAVSGEEPTASMGNDAALAVLSDRQPPLFSYFKQLFAQVTNPPIDPIREKVVMSLATSVGAEVNLLDESPAHAHQLFMKQPILRNHELEKLRQVSHDIFHAATIDLTWPVEQGPDGMERRLRAICDEASTWIERGANIVILSDRNLGAERVAIPSLLAVAAVHHHLVREGTRLRCGLVIETGEPREIHHMATLIGYGAAAINPYLMFESLDELADHGRLPIDLDRETAEQRIVRAIGRGLLKTFSKMGISTIQSYCGAQIFEAVGLEPKLVDTYFTGTSSRIGGIGMDVLAREALERHFRAYPRTGRETLPVGGVLQWRRDGERHIWNPDTIALLQHAVRSEDGKAGQTYDEFARAVNDEAARKASLRGLMKLKTLAEPIPLDEVESAEEIVKRFSTGAMSLGAISRESHEALAVAMNRIGGRSNTGEGGEDPARFGTEGNGDSRRSAIKQIASGRFGVTPHYLVNADQLQIKMAQGAKPGEGGQLPGHKVDDYIAWLRHSTPGVGLISPPPHHDIYSIEDLKQLIYDLRCSNPEATVSVKLVSEVGVGTVAAGVAKAHADHIVVAGHDGGTGASPASSIQAAGTPWEIGLAETQQTLLLNDLRSRVVVQADGQMKTGRDVVIAALLGADEVGFSTAPLIAMGCIMMRVCHLNTCPVGIATQNPELRARFQGTPDHVVKYLFFVAEEARRADGVDRRPQLRRDDRPHRPARDGRRDRPLEGARGRPQRRLRDAGAARGHAAASDDRAGAGARRRARLESWSRAPSRRSPTARRSCSRRTVRNVNRTVGGILSSRVAKRLGPDGLPEGTIEVALSGSAGQSFGAWLMPGVSFTLTGETNDYTGKGLAGGVLTVRPPADAAFDVERSPIVGNTVLYGATRGRAFFRGLAGERFAVRNSGAQRGRRGRRRPRLRVHDRRPRRRARPDRAQLRRRHERRHRLRLRRAPPLRRALQPGAGRAGAARRARRGGAEGPRRRSTRRAPARRSRSGSSTTGRAPPSASSR